MNKLVRIAVALVVMTGGLLAGAAPAHATVCNDSDKDVWVGDPELVFLGVNADPDAAEKGVCVRVAGMGANVFVPLIVNEPQPGLTIVAAGVRACTVETMAGPGERCVMASGSVTTNSNEPSTLIGTMHCVDPNPNEPFLWTCVSSGTFVGDPLFAYVCIQAAGRFMCVYPPPLR